MDLTSPSFAHHEDIPEKYTVDGENISPPLEIRGVPEKAQSLALIVQDLDAPIGIFTHWVVWNIPADTTRIEEGQAPPGAEEGMNGFGNVGYAGPCPPSGRHRYRFRLFALDSMLDATSPDRLDQIQSDMQDCILDKAILTGWYAEKQ